jgi:hypothetical protein
MDIGLVLQDRLGADEMRRENGSIGKTKKPTKNFGIANCKFFMATPEL